MAEIKKINTELQPIDKLLDTSGDAGTSGQILSTTGSGTNWIDNNTGDGTITGGSSGVDQEVTYWTGATVIDGDAGFKYNKGASNNSIITLTSTGLQALSFVDSNSAYADAMSILRDSDKLSLTYGHNANEEAITIVGGTGSDLGYVGIGTASPDKKVHIQGDAAVTGAFYDSSTVLIVEDTNPYLQIIGTDGGNQASTLMLTTVPAAGSGNNKHWAIQHRGTTQSGNFGISYDTTSASGQDGADGTDLFVIETGGNVGIGTVSPASLLHVYQNDTNANEVMFENDGTGDAGLTLRSDDNVDGSTFAFINFDANSSTDGNTRYARIRAYIEDNTQDTQDGKLLFTTIKNASDFDQLTLDSSGATFAGTVDAQGFRTTSGSTDYSLLTRNSANTAVYIQQAGSGNIVDFRYGSQAAGQGTSAMNITSSGDTTFAGNVTLGDDKNLDFGSATDFRIVHNSTTNVNHVSSKLDRQLSINANIIQLTNQANDSTYLKLESTGATFAGKILAGTGTTAAATINAYTATVSTNLYSALRIIENSAASTYWDIGATGGASPDLKFFVNAGTTPKFTLSTAGVGTFASNISVGGGQILTPGGINLALNPNTGVVSVGGVIQCSGAGASSFAGPVHFADGSVGTPSIVNTGDTNTGIYWPGDHQLGFAVNGSRKFYMSETQGYFQNLSSGISVSAGGINVTGDSTFVGSIGTTGDMVLKSDNVAALTLWDSGGAGLGKFHNNLTIIGKATSAATITGDGNTTLTTKGYVDGLIVGATIYQGTWDANNGAGGTPDLTTSTYKTNGYYFVVSVAGDATPNDPGTTPDDWHVGDWVIYNEHTGSSAWQKIDNSSVLSGTGQGQTVALWQGTSAVTDSETLGNAPITFSTNDATFAGNITASGGTLNLGNDVSIFDDGVNILRTDDAFHANNNIYIGGGGKIYDRSNNATYIHLAHPNMTFTTPSGLATFTGTLTSSDLTVTSSGGDTYFANFIPSTGSGYAKFYQSSNNHLSLYMANASGTANVVLNSSGVSYIKGGNLIIGGSSDSGELLQVEGTGYFAGAVTVDDQLTVSAAGTGNSPILSVTDTADTEVAWFTGNRAGDTGAYIAIRHLPSTAAESNRTGIKFQAKDDGGNTTTYATITQYIKDYTGATEDGYLAFSTIQNATLTEVMRISDNVGIGCTDPTGKLEIQKAQVTTQFDRDCFLRLHPSATTDAGGFTNMFFGTSTTNNYGVAIGGKREGTGDGEPTFAIRMLDDSIVGTEVLNINSTGNATFAGNISVPAGSKVLFDGSSGHTYIEEESDTNLKFYVAAGERLNLTNSYATFTVPVRTGSITTPTNTSLFLIPNGSGHVYLGDSGNGTNLYHYSTADDGKYTTYDFNGNYYRIATTATSGIKIDDTLTVTGVSTLANVGYLGDGLGSVQYTLQSSNTGYGTIDFGDVADSNIGRLEYNHNDNSFLIRTNNTTALTIDSSQNVGIGTTTPNAKLEVTDKILISDDSGNRPQLAFSENVANEDEVILEYNGSGAGTGNYFALYSGISGWAAIGEGLNFIPANGYVGIGTTIPVAKLSVTGTSAAANDIGIFQVTTGTGAHADTKLTVGVVDNDYAWLEAVNSGVAVRDIALNPRKGGAVGIGTTGPDAPLSVHGATGLGVGASGIRVHRPDSFGQFAFMDYGQSTGTAYFGSSYTGGTAAQYGVIVFRQLSNGGTASNSLTLGADKNATFVGNVSTSGASTDFNANASNLVVGSGSGNQGMTIFSGSSAGNYGSIYFADGRADGQEEYRGMITYEQNNEVMRFHTNTVEALKLDLSQNATFAGNVALAGEDQKITFGTSADLEIYHSGSDSYIRDTGTGSLRITASRLTVLNAANSETMIDAYEDGAVSLYHNNVVRLITTSTGVDVDKIGNDSSGSNITFSTNGMSWVTGSGTMSMNSAGTLSLSHNLLVAGINSTSDITLTSSDLVLSGDSNVVLDTSLSSAQSSGTIIRIGSESSMTFGKCYALASGTWEETDPTDENFSKQLLGIALGTDADVDGMLTTGVFYDASHSFTVGEPLYLSTTTGTLTTTAPNTSGDLIRVVGYAIDANHIYFCPDNTWVILD